MKHIRDHVKENVLVSLKIEEPDYARALFEEGKGWVCTLRGEVVGFSCGRIKQGDVWALFIDSKVEGFGIGSRLMEPLEAWMFSQGCEEIVLSTNPGTRAERLYRRRGWVETGLRPSGELGFRLRNPGENTRPD